MRFRMCWHLSSLIRSWVDGKFMPFRHFVRIGSEVFFEGSTHWSLTDSRFCSHFCSRNDVNSFSTFPSYFSPDASDCSFSVFAWSVACFTSFHELFNHIPNSFMANVQLFRDARITLTFLYRVTIVFLSTAISKINFLLIFTSAM